MEVVVQGVRVKLTAEQIAIVVKEQKRRKKCRGSFDKILEHFGFKKCDTTTWADPTTIAWLHDYYDWFAHIVDHGSWSSLWMVGTGLKTTVLYRDGWGYDSPEEVEKEIVRALDELGNKDIDN